MTQDSWIYLMQNLQRVVVILAFVSIILSCLVVARSYREWGFLSIGSGFILLLLNSVFLTVYFYQYQTITSWPLLSTFIVKQTIAVPGWLLILVGLARLFHGKARLIHGTDSSHAP